MPGVGITTQRAEKQQPMGSCDHEPLSANRPLVLVVETDLQTRRFVRHFLEHAGYAVDFAEDGYAALDRVRANHPTLLITEIIVPRLDGLALCRLLKGDLATSKVPILVYSELDSGALACESGANAFTKKTY